VISVILPTLNEADNLPETLATLKALNAPLEIVLVDAGSTDSTVSLAEACGARVIRSKKRQRAHQLNAGAAAATGDVLWFLHADTWVKQRAAESIVVALRNPGVVGGGFKRRFRSASPLLVFTCWIASLRSRWFGLFFGDQSIFVRRVVFDQVGGFADVPVFEDFDFCQRIKEFGKMRSVGPAVRSSARRFQKRGVITVVLQDLWLTWHYHRGESPESIMRRIRRG
jgi:rSAM/selenodomain-associated transferase 2